MSLRTSLRWREPRSVVWNPEQIPRSLKYSVWDFERTPQITVDGSNGISPFVDPVTGASFSQATAGSRPILDATGFNGRPCGTFDGTADNLRNTTALATLGWPTSGAFEVWSLIHLLDLSVTTTWFAYPVSGNAGLVLQAVPAVANVRPDSIRATIGLGASTVSIDAATAVGRHLVRFVSDGTNCRLDVNGATGTTTAAAASFTGGPRNTIGGSAAASAANFFNGKINFLALYKPLPSDYAAKLTAHLNIRKG